MSKQKTKQYNVTNMTPKQRRNLFIKCMNQHGFVGFVKNQTNKQTHYTFQYNNNQIELL
jgi:hypothetical protein